MCMHFLSYPMGLLSSMTGSMVVRHLGGGGGTSLPFSPPLFLSCLCPLPLFLQRSMGGGLSLSSLYPLAFPTISITSNHRHIFLIVIKSVIIYPGSWFLFHSKETQLTFLHLVYPIQRGWGRLAPVGRLPFS